MQTGLVWLLILFSLPLALSAQVSPSVTISHASISDKPRPRTSIADEKVLVAGQTDNRCNEGLMLASIPGPSSCTLVLETPKALKLGHVPDLLDATT